MTERDLNDANYHRKLIKFDSYKGKTCKQESSDTDCLKTVIDNKGEKVCAVVKDNSNTLPKLRKDPG